MIRVRFTSTTSGFRSTMVRRSSRISLLSCAACSLFKGPNPAGYDPETDVLHPLYNPRTQPWSEHFAWNGTTLKGMTAIGRTTITVLRIKEPLRVRHREPLIALEVFPPDLSSETDE